MRPAIVALLVIGQRHDYNSSNLPVLINSVRALASRLEVFQCFEDTVPAILLAGDINATVCDTRSAVGQHRRWEACYACASGLVDLRGFTHVIRARPDMTYLEPIRRDLFVLKEPCINAKARVYSTLQRCTERRSFDPPSSRRAQVRAARGVVGLTDEYFSWLWGTSECEAGMCNGGCKECYLVDDAFAIMSPRVAATYFRVATLAEGPAYRWYTSSPNSCIHDTPWPEHFWTAALLAHDVCINPIRFEFRLNKYLNNTPSTTGAAKNCGVVCSPERGCTE